jgi:adenine-specific DNA-methyltransferase
MGYRYIGAKTRLVPELIGHLRSLLPEGGRVADVMCGTAAVSGALRRNGFAVIANDVMTYSVHHARVELLFVDSPEFAGADDFLNDHLPLHAEELLPQNRYQQMIRALNAVEPIHDYFWNEFSISGSPKNATKPRNYFSPENAAKIDAIRFWISHLQAKGAFTDAEHSLLLHDLIMGLNDIANIAGTYGHYLNRTIGRAHDPISLKPTALFTQRDEGKHLVLQGYAEDVAAKLECDLCYIDPPYMKRQYAANYHLLETIARGDNPEAIGESGLRPWRDQYSNFCTKTKIYASFERIVATMNCPRFVVSYSEDGLLSIEQLRSFLERFGTVSVQTVRNKRFKSNESALAPDINEYLLTLQKNRVRRRPSSGQPIRPARVPGARLSCTA